jgi:hypothetical protein
MLTVTLCWARAPNSCPWGPHAGSSCTSQQDDALHPNQASHHTRNLIARHPLVQYCRSTHAMSGSARQRPVTARCSTLQCSTLCPLVLPHVQHPAKSHHWPCTPGPMHATDQSHTSPESNKSNNSTPCWIHAVEFKRGKVRQVKTHVHWQLKS